MHELPTFLLICLFRKMVKCLFYCPQRIQIIWWILIIAFRRSSWHELQVVQCTHVGSIDCQCIKMRTAPTEPPGCTVFPRLEGFTAAENPASTFSSLISMSCIHFFTPFLWSQVNILHKSTVLSEKCTTLSYSTEYRLYSKKTENRIESITNV